MAEAAKQSSLLDQAVSEFPVLKGMDIGYTMTPGNDNRVLEFWPPDEPGPEDKPRPAELDLKKPGIQVFNENARPIDILGDIVSHKLIDDDATVKKHYDKFKSSLSDDQKEILKEQYEYAKANHGEERSFKEWRDRTGLPAYFRGYAFQQWGDSREHPEIAKMYTPKQLDDFDRMMDYLRTEPKAKKDRKSIIYDNPRSKPKD